MTNQQPIIYILCIANLQSGGPEALHQLRFYMDQVGLDVYIAYFNTTEGVDPMPEVYSNYGIKCKHISEIVDCNENIIITAESNTIMLNGFGNVKKYIWWLSVNWFDYKPLTNKILFRHKLKKLFGKETSISSYCNFKLGDCTHMCGSRYAYEYVLSLGIKNPFYLVEPISKVFLESRSQTDYERNDIVLYNPAKPSEIMSKLLEENRFQFKALTKMTPNELIESYKNAKLYIDFGHFGGPERMPKEAVYFECCILVGRRNASENDFDIAIPDDYKITDYNNLNEVNSKIEYILLNYDKCLNDFTYFKSKVSLLEENFINQIKECFCKLK